MVSAQDNPLFVVPKIMPALDAGFRPGILSRRHYQSMVDAHPDSVECVIGLERNEGRRTVQRFRILPPGSPDDGWTQIVLERLVKFLLWQVGGYRLYLGVPVGVGEALRAVYSVDGARAFDARLMESVYGQPFRVELCSAEEVPASAESSVALGGHLEGCRIGFDLGASDYKLAAVKDGEAVFTTEIPWDPKNQPDPEWHYGKINEGLKLAAGHLPRVDAIGGSSAGIFIDNQVKVASLFRSVPQDQFHDRVRPLFLRLREEWKVPLEVVNDGDVTALAGGMSLRESGVLGIAMGSSEAAGYLDPEGRITGWLNELAFAPVDYRPEAPVDEWSGDVGCGALHFSQQAVGRLVGPAGIELEPEMPLPEKLKAVQALMAQGDPRARRVYETIGVYLGYGLAQYAEMYPYRHALVLGRVTSGAGGEVLVAQAKGVLQAEFPDLAERLSLQLPDEKSKRVGQAVAAASLPRIEGS